MQIEILEEFEEWIAMQNPQWIKTVCLLASFTLFPIIVPTGLHAAEPQPSQGTTQTSPDEIHFISMVDHYHDAYWEVQLLNDALACRGLDQTINVLSPRAIEIIAKVMPDSRRNEALEIIQSELKSIELLKSELQSKYYSQN